MKKKSANPFADLLSSASTSAPVMTPAARSAERRKASNEVNPKAYRFDADTLSKIQDLRASLAPEFDRFPSAAAVLRHLVDEKIEQLERKEAKRKTV